MNRNTGIDTDGALLKSMIALMLSLATRVEWAAGQCFAVRCFILWAVHRAVPIALGHVFGDEAPKVSAFSTLFHNSREDALELAELFRAAALALKGELREVQRFDKWWARYQRRLPPQSARHWLQARSASSSPHQGDGGPELGEGMDTGAMLAARLSTARHNLCHVILTRARIPAWAAINRPDTS